MAKEDTTVSLADVLAAIGAVGQRVDAVGARVDAMEKDRNDEKVCDPNNDSRKDGESEDDFKERMAKKDAAKKDAEEKERKDAEEKACKDAEEKERKDAEEAEAKKKADASKKDAEGEAERMAADAKKDAEKARADAAAATKENADLKARLGAIEARMPKERSDDDHRTMSAVQARADSVYELFGKNAPRFLNGETSREYRTRLVRGMQEHSRPWKEIDVGALADSAFTVAEEQIYADASVAAKNAIGVADGGLRMVPGTTASGHKETRFYGRPSAWLGRFGGVRRFATKINPNPNRGEVA